MEQSPGFRYAQSGLRLLSSSLRAKPVWDLIIVLDLKKYAREQSVIVGRIQYVGKSPTELPPKFASVWAEFQRLHRTKTMQPNHTRC